MLRVLPAVLSCGTLECWIDLKSLVCLDTAHCNRTDRLTLFSSKEYVFRNPVAINKLERISWLSAKMIKVSNVLFGSDLYPEVLSDYLRMWGAAITKVQIWRGQTTYEMHLLAIHCKNIQVVRCDGFTLEPAFKELLWCNPGISEIWLNNMQSSSNKLFNNVPLNRLSTLSISNCMCNNNFPLPITSVNLALQKLLLGSSLDPDVLLKMVHLCPALKSLSLKNMQLTSTVLDEACSVLPNLLHLDVSNNHNLNTDGVLAMCKYLTQLRSISILNCTNVCDYSIRTLAEYCGGTLEIVCMDIKRANCIRTIDRLMYFSDNCRKLQYLSIHCNKSVLCLAGGTFALLHDLPMLQTLVVDAEEVICVTSRQFLRWIYPQLRIVQDKEGKYAYNALSMQI